MDYDNCVEYRGPLFYVSKFCFSFLCLIIIFIPETSLSQGRESHSGKLYPNTFAKDFQIDAPWFISNIDTRIPVQFIVKDSDVIDLEELEGLYIEIPRSRTGYDFSVTDTIFRKVYSPVIEDMSVAFWDTIVFIGVPSGYSAGQTLYIKATIDYEDGFLWDEYFSKVLAIKIGNSPIPTLDDWYSGDCHFHTSFTQNAYESGGTYRMLGHCARAMGVDFVTATDHASDSSYVFGFLADDLNLSDWLVIPDSIALYGSDSPIIVRGEEADVFSGTSARNHLLIYGNNDFFPAPIPDGNAEKTHMDAFNFLLSSPEAVSYPAHPYNPDYLWEFAVIDSGVRMGVFQGIQIWNERAVFSVDVDMDEYCDPFPFSSGEMHGTGGLWDSDLLSGIEQWNLFLQTYIDEATTSPPLKIFINGGSDAHGDFNYFCYYPFVFGVPLPDIYATDNAFAKVRTYIYCPEGLNQRSIINALRNGNSIVTDGPIVVFKVAKNDDTRDKIIGDTDTVYYENTDSLRITYKNTVDFGGNIEHINIVKIFSGPSSPQKVSMDDLIEGLEGDFAVPLDLPIDSGWCCYWIEARTFSEGEQYTDPDNSFRCITNPIWFYVLPDTTTVDIAEMIEKPFLLDIRPNPFNSALSITAPQGAEIEIYDVNGRCIEVIPVGSRPASTALDKTTSDAGVAPTIREYKWTPDDNIGSGVYLVRATVGEQSVTKRIVYLK